MVRQPRRDAEGTWHHVMNRGLARRTMFENVKDVRFFLARVVREVRRGNIELHSFCIMTTHFHMLIRVLKGRLCDVMRRIQNSFVRRFNRTRHRDGPLVKGRFVSRLVESLTYRNVLVRYIDENVTSAKLAKHSFEYPFCSAMHYVRSDGPRWLTRSWIESCIMSRSKSSSYDPSKYPAIFGRPLTPELEYMVQRRMDVHNGPDDLDDLVGAAPDRVLAWMKRKAMLADGTRPGLPVADHSTVRRVIDDLKASCPTWNVKLTRKRRDGWLLLENGILRDLCGLRWVDIASILDLSASHLSKMYRAHSELLESDEVYAERSVVVAQKVVGEVWDGPGE